MTRAQLEHAIRAACDVTGDSEVYVFGSQAILAEFPDAPAALRRSVEADVAPKNLPEKLDAIDGALGELSHFHRTHGFYVHGVPLDSGALPAGWDERLVEVRNANTRQNTGWCLEAHDLAASKLAAFREKDREFVRTLLVERLIDAETLLDRIGLLTRPAPERKRLTRWVQAMIRDLSA